MPEAVAEKALQTDAIKRTVQQPPPGQGPFFSGQGAPGWWMVASLADEIAPWGINVKLRDKQLRDFITAESVFASALGIICARNSAFSWTLEGPPEEVKRLQRVLQSADLGAGWQSLISKVTTDLSTQDHGAFIEVIRAKDSPDADVVGLAHLESQRCWPTGLPETPVLYQGRSGEYHILKWYSVVQLLEMPATIESLPGSQYSSLTRILRSVQRARDIAIYLGEKIGGRNTRAITLVRGVTAKAIEEAMLAQQVNNNARNLFRFSQPVMVNSIDAEAEVDFKTLELASLPDGFDQIEEMKQYLGLIAMGFETDYQEFAPLPGGGLGTSAQSEVLHLKSRGKGPGLFMKIIAAALNWNVLPENVEFKWIEPDIEAEMADANVKLVRAQTRASRIVSGEINPQVARIQAHEAGDLTKEELEIMEKADAAAAAAYAAQVVVPDTSPDAANDAANQVLGQQTISADEHVTIAQPAAAGGAGAGKPTVPGTGGAPAIAAFKPPSIPARPRIPNTVRKEVTPVRLAVEDHLAGPIEEAFAELFTDLKKRPYAAAAS